MKVTVICLFFLTQLQNGEVESVQGRTYTEMEGKNITVSCSFTFTGRRMYFCKTDCSRDNILIETTDYRTQSGRYIIEFNRTGFASHVVYVSIMELKISDSGRYRCALGRTGIRHNDFKIFVISASPTATTSTGSQSFSSSPPFSSETTKQSSSSAPPSGVLLSVGVVLTIMVIILAAALLVFFKHRKNKQLEGSAEPSGGTEYATVIKPNRVKRKPETQNTAESDNLDYSEVHFSKQTTNLHSSAPCGNHGDVVIYTEPRIDGKYGGRSEEDSAALYSTITLQK
ncbi:PREDICTED: uncharacterized protein LOC106932963 isoform X2 [Poecilia mexicana]|uniref:uncharacterized protein LOC106932963 isoform X2 n=1 Tax=Poecilia mexicana TaxID=48701 RepID=UPI00072E8D40|nr:PREDICTED: uncharacterized protein LOC106932963 isoform X2 [Poecilia mexicana]